MKVVKSNFLEAYKEAKEKELKIASIQDLIKLGESFPELMTPDRHICSGTIIACPENEKRPVGKEISFYNPYNRFYTIFSVPEKFRDNNVGFLMDSGTYELNQENNVIKINPLAGIEFNTILTWGNKGFNVLCFGSNEEIYKLTQKIPLIQRAGKYVGPLFTGGLYGLEKVSNTPSLVDKHHFLLVETTSVKKDEKSEELPEALEELVANELSDVEINPKQEPVVQKQVRVYWNYLMGDVTVEIRKAREVLELLGMFEPHKTVRFLDTLERGEYTNFSDGYRLLYQLDISPAQFRHELRSAKEEIKQIKNELSKHSNILNIFQRLLNPTLSKPNRVCRLINK